MIDLHCHILPGVDDGAKTVEEALDMARVAQSDGIKIIVATPHLLREKFDFEGFDSIQKRRQDLNEAFRTNNIPVEVKSGAEVYISHNLIEEIRRKREPLVLNESSYMFIEFPIEHIYQGVKNLFFDLMSEGITPIVTHPERNSVFKQHPELLYELVQMGALAQANSGSFFGLYGRKSAVFVRRLLEWNLVHFIASDGHNAHSMPPRLSEAVREAKTLIGEERASAMVNDNPQAVLEDREIPYLAQALNPRTSRKTLHIKIPDFLRRRR
jgi:protein-tyrosine phosphatase